MARSTCPMCREEHWRLGRASVMGSLAAAPRRLAASLRRARGPRQRRRPAPREWSVVEVLAHLLDVEIALSFRVRKAVAEPGSVLTPWDQERWTPGLRHQRADWLPRSGAPSPGTRSTGASGSIRMVTHVAEHDLSHLQQIQTTLKALARR